MIFAVIWWLILELHGDFETDNLPLPRNTTAWNPCVKEIYGFTSIFLFSIEIHTAVGYGKRTITLDCPSAVFTMCIESIAGHITKSVIIGIVFAKLTKPKYRRSTLLFSKNAIINQRDGYLCLLYRLGNIRKSRIISPSLKAFLIRYERKSDKNVSNTEQIELNVKVDGSDDILFIFPITIVHKIDENSPLYNISAKNMLELDLEILVVFEGIIESTGQTVQAISSYTTQEILWGRRFSQSVYYDKRKHGFVENFGKFNESYSVNTPLCRPSDLERYNEKRKTLLLQKYLLYLRDFA